MSAAEAASAAATATEFPYNIVQLHAFCMKESHDNYVFTNSIMSSRPKSLYICNCLTFHSVLFVYSEWEWDGDISPDWMNTVSFCSHGENMKNFLVSVCARVCAELSRPIFHTHWITNGCKIERAHWILCLNKCNIIINNAKTATNWSHWMQKRPEQENNGPKMIITIIYLFTSLKAIISRNWIAIVNTVGSV